MAATAAGEVGVISHVQEHGFHVGKPKRLLARSLVLSEDVKLSQRNLIALAPVFFSEVGAHVLDKGAGDVGRKIERQFSDHALSSSKMPPGFVEGSIRM
jgi:hypothetical protein